MTIERFKKENIPSHVLENCSVYIHTKSGIFPAIYGSSVMTVNDISDNIFEIKKSIEPIMTNDGKFEREKIIIYEDGHVKYMPQRKIDDSETEYIYRNEFYRYNNK